MDVRTQLEARLVQLYTEMSDELEKFAIRGGLVDFQTAKFVFPTDSQLPDWEDRYEPYQAVEAAFEKALRWDEVYSMYLSLCGEGAEEFMENCIRVRALILNVKRSRDLMSRRYFGLPDS